VDVPFSFCIITSDFCRFVLLVLESARVEVAVLLNEIAFSKYESSKSSQKDDAISQKQRNLAILFSLIERIIEMISDASSGEGSYTFLVPWAGVFFCNILLFPLYQYL
jgi:hypothetical protein